MTCKRPGCTRAVTQWGHGYCAPHAYATGTLKHRVPSEPVRHHLQHCIDHGATITGIAAGTGCTPSIVSYRLHPTKSGTMKATVAARLMQATPTMAGRVPAWPTVRRIQALRANGMTGAEIRAEAGISVSTLDILSHHKQERIAAEVATRVNTLWRARKDDTPRTPTSRTQRWGWTPPADWDNIDNPHENPHARRIAETIDPTQLANALINHYGTSPAVAEACGFTSTNLTPGRVLRPGVTHKLRVEWCRLHNLDIPQVDPLRTPQHLTNTLRRYAEEAGLRWLPHIDHQDRCQIHSRSSAAATLGITPSLVDRILNRGMITPQEYDRVCLALGISMEAAA